MSGSYAVVVIQGLGGDVARHVDAKGVVTWYLDAAQSQSNAARMIRLVDPSIHPDDASQIAATALPDAPVLRLDDSTSLPGPRPASRTERFLWFCAGATAVLIASLIAALIAWGPYVSAHHHH